MGTIAAAAAAASTAGPDAASALSVGLRDGSARSSSVRSDAVMRLTTRLAQRAPVDCSSMLSLKFAWG